MNTSDTLNTNHSGHTGAQNNSLISAKTLGICLGFIALAIVAVTLFNVSVSILIFAGVLLACPLLHVFMMRSGGHKH